jgi:hypothetical protein
MRRPCKTHALERLLAAIAIAIFILNDESGLITLPMALLVVPGEFYLSVAAIAALASTLMRMAAQVGASTPMLVAICDRLRRRQWPAGRLFSGCRRSWRRSAP